MQAFFPLLGGEGGSYVARLTAGRPRAATAGALGLSFFLFRKGNGPGGAGRQALFPGAAAFVCVPDRGLAFDQFIDLFTAGLDAGSAPVAEILVYGRSFEIHVLLSFVKCQMLLFIF